MARQIERLHWSAERWAHEADLAPTTVTRAMSPNYKSVSSVPTLHALARAAGVPSIIDFLDSQTNLTPRSPVLAAVLRELLPTVGYHVPEEKIVTLSEGISATLAGLAEQDGENGSDPELARKLARAWRATLHR
jgi:hypothetical protein